jgi:hypothetical protein
MFFVGIKDVSVNALRLNVEPGLFISQCIQVTLRKSSCPINSAEDTVHCAIKVTVVLNGGAVFHDPDYSIV